MNLNLLQIICAFAYWLMQLSWSLSRADSAVILRVMVSIFQFLPSKLTRPHWDTSQGSQSTIAWQPCVWFLLVNKKDVPNFSNCIVSLNVHLSYYIFNQRLIIPIGISLLCTIDWNAGKFAISWLSLCCGNIHTGWSLIPGTKLNFSDYCTWQKVTWIHTCVQVISAKRYFQGRGQRFPELIVVYDSCEVSNQGGKIITTKKQNKTQTQ